MAKLAGRRCFYCSFCLRKSLHTKNSRNTLMLSFRSIVGYFYYINFNVNGSRRMYLADIEDYIDFHVRVGLMNPLFDYDPETFLWFVDFSRVGDSKRRLPLDEVLRTVVNILACFNLSENVPGTSMSGLMGKYREAMVDFHERRYRPNVRKMLIPTLAGADSKLLEKTRSFTIREMSAKKY